MSDASFDRRRFTERLTAAHWGHYLVTRASVESTNDDAWDALAQGAPDGALIVADEQTKGRGRLGRVWVTTPGRGLAMSLLLHVGCDPEPLATLPLVAGLSLATGLEKLGARVDLKWPNDLLLDGRKVAGILCEGRRSADGSDVAVVGVGVNVAQTREEFPPELRDTATSLALAGHAIAREDVAAEFVNAFEPTWAEHAEGDRSLALERWKARATFWGAPVTVHTPAGPLRGIARTLDDLGALMVETADGSLARVTAGDVEVDARDRAAPPERSS